MSDQREQASAPIRITEHERRGDAFDGIDFGANHVTDDSDEAVTGERGRRLPRLGRKPNRRDLVLVAATAVICLGAGTGIGAAAFGGPGPAAPVVVDQNGKPVSGNAALNAANLNALPAGVSAQGIIDAGTVEDAGDRYAKQTAAVAKAISDDLGVKFKAAEKPTVVKLTVGKGGADMLYQVSAPVYTATKVTLSPDERKRLIDDVNSVVVKYGFSKFDLDSLYSGPYSTAKARVAAFGSEDPLTATNLSLTGIGKTANESYAVNIASQITPDAKSGGGITVTFTTGPHVHAKDVAKLKALAQKEYAAKDFNKDAPSTVATPDPEAQQASD